MRHLNNLLGATILSAALLPSLGCADTATVKDRYSDDELVSLLKADGYSSVENSKPGAITIRVDGQRHALLVQPDGDLQLYYGVALPGPKLSTADMNTWNRTKRLSRAYLDDEQDPALEADLMSNGGISRANIREFVKVFVNTSVPAFRQFLRERSGDR